MVPYEHEKKWQAEAEKLRREWEERMKARAETGERIRRLLEIEERRLPPGAD